MKLVTYLDAEGDEHVGAWREDGIAVLKPWEMFEDMIALLSMGDEGIEAAKEAAASASIVLPHDSVTLKAPVPYPGKVVAVGHNYRKHVEEQNAPMPEVPIMFCKFSDTVIGPNAEIQWDPELTQAVDYEVELGVVIGTKARKVAEEEALDYVAGYLVANDVSARDLQFGDGQWLRGKSLDTFCPMGPWLVTRDEVPNPHDLAIRCELNGETMQDGRTDDMIFAIPELIARMSRAFTLHPGDVILTGTPSGVGYFRDPRVCLKGDDEISVEIEGLGRLTNRCVEVG